MPCPLRAQFPWGRWPEVTATGPGIGLRPPGTLGLAGCGPDARPGARGLSVVSYAPGGTGGDERQAGPAGGGDRGCPGRCPRREERPGGRRARAPARGGARGGSAGRACLGYATLCHPGPRAQVGSSRLAKKPASLDVMTPNFGDLCSGPRKGWFLCLLSPRRRWDDATRETGRAKLLCLIEEKSGAVPRRRGGRGAGRGGESRAEAEPTRRTAA